MAGLLGEQKETQVYAKYDEEIIATVRRPIQCEGIERGPKRIAEVAVNGSMNPQADFSDLIQYPITWFVPLNPVF
jgi:hypothetical protein